MAEEKTAKKPRAPKKAGAGTKLPEEKKQDTAPAEAQVFAKDTLKTADKTEAVSEEKAVKKAPAKRARKKAEAPAVEAPIEKLPAVETVTAEVVVVEQPKADEVKTSETVKAPAKRTRKKVDKKAEADVSSQAQETVETQENDLPAVEQSPVEQEKKAEAEKAVPKKQGKKQSKKQEQKQEKPVLTKAEKRAFVKKLIRDCLQEECRWSELIDRVAQDYKDAYPLPENDNLNDVKGRVGSIVHLLQEEGEIVMEGNLVKKAVSGQKTEQPHTVSAENEQLMVEETAETAEKMEDVQQETTVEISVSEQPVQEVAKQPALPSETSAQSATQTSQPVSQTTAAVKVEAVAPVPVYDLSALFDTKRPAKKSVADVVKEKTEEQTKTAPASTEKEPVKEDSALKEAPVKAGKTEKKSAPKKQDDKQKDDQQKQEEKPAEKQVRREVPTRRPMRSAKADPLKDSFLKKLRALGGNYFEYYAIYLLERYSRMNGRRLEGLRISGGEYDGGIDGELELTDRLGFRETIYIQAKNWEPTDDKWWIGETILQQFIGAVTYRQAKEGKQHCRGLFITTSAFTTGAKEMLDKLSDKFVGYDADDLYETAKECQFGLIKDEKGNWKVDEELLSGKKSFFFML